MNKLLYKNWWFLLVKAFLSVVIGFLILFMPHTMADKWILLFALALGIGGLVLIAGSFTHMILNSDWTWWLIEGLIDILICTIIIFNAVDSAYFLCTVAGIWLAMMGFIYLITAINIQYYVRSNSVFVITAIILILSGVFFIVSLEIGLNLLMILVGAIILTYGILQIYISFVLKNVSVEEIGEIEDLY